MRTLYCILYTLSTFIATSFSQVTLLASCNNNYEFTFQWNPLTPGSGNLIGRTLGWKHQMIAGLCQLTCEDGITIYNPNRTVVLEWKAGTEVSFSLQHLNINKKQYHCSLKYCPTRLGIAHCSEDWHNWCDITIPAHVNPPPDIILRKQLQFQWLPANEQSGSLIISGYEQQNATNYQYELLCDGFEVENYTFETQQRMSESLKADLLATSTVVDSQYACFLHICANLPTLNTCSNERGKRTYLIVIPDVSNGVVLQRPSVFYHHRQWLNSTVQFQSNSSCANIKFYQLNNADYKGTQVIVTYRPSSEMIRPDVVHFNMTCGSQSTPVIIPDVLIQPYVDITLQFLLQQVPDAMFCSLGLCMGEVLGDNCSSHCGITISNVNYIPSLESDTSSENGVSELDLYPADEESDDIETSESNDTMIEDSEPCPSSKWLWVAHSVNEGEAHFLIRDDIATAMTHGEAHLSCDNLDVVSVNSQPLYSVMMDGYVASYVVHTRKNSQRFEKCVLNVCVENDGGCEDMYRCNIMIVLRQGEFVWGNYVRKFTICAKNLWQWSGTENGGTLSVKFRTKNKERSSISIDCTGIDILGNNEINNSDISRFKLQFNNHQDSPQCNVMICVTQKNFIGCKKSLYCALMIPTIKRIPRSVVTPNYEEPLEDLLQNCRHQQNFESNGIVESCSDKMWELLYTSGYSEGEVTLQIHLQGNSMVDEFLKVTVYCSGLDLKGPSEQKLIIPRTQDKSSAQFNISLPDSVSDQPRAYQCVVKIQRKQIPHLVNRPMSQDNDTICPSAQFCNVSIQAMFGRILPKCNITKGKSSVHKLDIQHDRAAVEIMVAPSPNDVYTVDAYCTENNPFGYNKTKEMLENAFPSNTADVGQFAVSISFYPECENQTISDYFTNKRMENCTMDLYWYCQRGEQLLEHIKNLQFSDESMYCETPSVMRSMVQSLERSFGVESEPVVVLLTILLGVAGLYTVTIPTTIVIAYINCKRKKLIPGTHIECKHHMEDDSTDSTTLHNEMTAMDGYDDVELIPDVPPRRQSLFYKNLVVIDEDDKDVVTAPVPPTRRESIKPDIIEIPALPSLPAKIGPVPPALAPPLPPLQRKRTTPTTISEDIMSQTPPTSETVPLHEILPPPLVPSPPATPQNNNVSLIIDTPPSPS
ncbi:uncharacterized protein [Dysidea avara]|uniref:uncharacterized protein isoform X3 n=1 Tax=Dysidea avara TaxID=196820 RepID=UPI00332FF3D3